MSSFRIGILSAVSAQIMWGLFPVYWNLLASVSPLEVLGHRNIWCAIFLSLLVISSTQRRSVVRSVFAQPKEILHHLFSSILIAGNWLVYIWAVVSDHVIDASLGYFLSPLVSVVLGYVVFAERPKFSQWCAVALATAGVVVMIISSGVVPWIGLALAATFGVYGMTRKKATTGPVNGLFIETLLLVPASAALLAWLAAENLLSYESQFGQTEILLALGGLITAIPLVLYAQGARALPLSLSGLLVYITPSIQFLIGWLFYREPISVSGWVGFSCIWAALVIYSFSIGRVKTRL
ncbi:hypothetical protein AB833_20680 [Chromatiales bacterium (ex Bugula neritina AB1)]|nr:hypothetical protein AB833_20680 [Chromatiales bacterium (ex Bugula neritina AB1)]